MDMSKAGVYMILNVLTNERYVGSIPTPRTFSTRWSEHKSSLKHRRSKNPPMQEAWNRNGPEVFQFIILEVLSGSTTEREQWWMDHFRSLGLPLYNRCPDAASHTGLVMPREAVERGAQKRVGQKRSEATCAKLRILKHDWTPHAAIAAHTYDWPPLVSPKGVVHPVHNLLDFCSKHGLDVSAMRKVCLGKRQSHKGWILSKGGKPVPYSGKVRVVGAPHTVVAPDGTLYKRVTNLEAFCREHGLDPSAMRRVCKREHRHHHGWTCCP